ncbi:type I secretion system permease/ATPase [Marinobacter hydrocarbonoclasticus]|uniref:type I secretion system permease/ATPase n=1 Tax=Marinobacter nauticus TaxID=2743 RepID=UPI001C958DD1|nr:type I secretion system permease/ATPase [Marinobacter nauticus]MBY6194584.1 type I secretion system permease/ATPase [Marinobacter nauticus]MBY6215732.1 type I secretion system permease/ATPase [Marinobacter nauticus]
MIDTGPEQDNELLKLVAEYCALHGRVVTTRKLSLSDDRGMNTPHRITLLLTSQGFKVSSDTLSLEALRAERGPWLIKLRGHSWCLLLEVSDSEAIVRDATGADSVIPLSEFSGLEQLEVLMARPLFRTQARVGDFAKVNEGHWFWRPLLGHWQIFRDVGIAAIVANCLAAAVALFAMQVYDRVVPTGAQDTLWVLAVGAVLAITLEWIIRATRVALLESAGQRLDQQIGRILFSRAISIRVAHLSPSPGTLVTQLREFESVREFFTSATTALLSDLPFVCFFVAAIAFIGGELAMVPLVAMALLILPVLVLQPFMSQLASESLRESAHKNGLLWETFSGIENVKASGAERWLEGLWADLHEHLSETTCRVRKLSQWVALWTMAAQQFAYVAVIVVGVYLIHNGTLSIGGLVACSILVSRVIAPLSQASGLLARWQHVKSALASLDGLMESPTERSKARQFVESPNLTGAFSIERMAWAAAPDQSPIIKVEKLSVSAGQSIAVLGASGSGKSTLLKLMSGLVSPTEGQITVDNLNLDHVDPVDRSDQIAYLPQSVAIFQGTLRDNLNPAQKRVTDKELMRICESIGLSAFINSRPTGLDTIVMSEGAISGGQRQLIGLVRVLVCDPRIVLLDEPTAALDQETEKRVISVLCEWARGRTLVISTHKRALLRLAERLLVIKEGLLVMDTPAHQAVSPQATQTSGSR